LKESIQIKAIGKKKPEAIGTTRNKDKQLLNS